MGPPDSEIRVRAMHSKKFTVLYKFLAGSVVSLYLFKNTVGQSHIASKNSSSIITGLWFQQNGVHTLNFLHHRFDGRIIPREFVVN